MFCKRLTILLAVVLFFIPVAVFSITIDEFEGDQSVDSGPFEVNSSSLIVPMAPGGQRSTAIGGSREFTVQGITGSAALRTRLLAGLGFLSHSQDSGASGISRVTWDGNNNPSVFDPTGLGGVDFTQDGSSAFQIEILRFDSPAGKPVTFDILVHSSATSSSKVSYTLTTAITSLTTITIPFSDFTRDTGASLPADFSNVGAVQLIIYGLDEDIDLRLEWLGTNACRYVPDDALMVVDECGVCNGDNTSCADCLGVPNGSAQPGTICDNGEVGVCSGGTFTNSCDCMRNTEPGTELCDGLDNDCDGQVDEAFPGLGEECGVGTGSCAFYGTKICNASQTGLECEGATQLQIQSVACEESKGCDGVPNSGLTEDLCGVCGGDNSSCADCKGMPNGTAERDRCGICNGDGQSCLNCTTYNQSVTLHAMDNGAKLQEDNIKKVLVALKRVHRTKAIVRFAKRIENKAFDLQDENWNLSWDLPIMVNQCGNKSFCISQSNQPILEQYKENALGLKELGIKAIRKLKKFAPDYKKLKRFERRNNNLYTQNIETAETVPIVQSVCS